MNDEQRFLLFFMGCIPVRLGYAIFQNSRYGIWWLNILIGIMFIYKWATWKGEKGAFGGVLWWNHMRLIHGILFILSGRYPVILYIDIVVGILATINNRFNFI